MSIATHNKTNIRPLIARAMQDSDQWAIRMDYRDRNDVVTSRFISPIRFLAPDRFLALCLCREEPRQFYLERCEEVVLIPADEILMPMHFAIAG